MTRRRYSAFAKSLALEVRRRITGPALYRLAGGAEDEQDLVEDRLMAACEDALRDSCDSVVHRLGVLMSAKAFGMHATSEEMDFGGLLPVEEEDDDDDD